MHRLVSFPPLFLRLPLTRLAFMRRFRRETQRKIVHEWRNFFFVFTSIVSEYFFSLFSSFIWSDYCKGCNNTHWLFTFMPFIWTVSWYPRLFPLIPPVSVSGCKNQFLHRSLNFYRLYLFSLISRQFYFPVYHFSNNFLPSEHSPSFSLK